MSDNNSSTTPPASLTQELTKIASAIRLKQGTNLPIRFKDFAEAISNIEGSDVDLSEALALVGLDIPTATQAEIDDLSGTVGLDEDNPPAAGSEYYSDNDLNELSNTIGAAS